MCARRRKPGKRAWGGHIGARAVKVWACSWCGCWHLSPSETQCQSCAKAGDFIRFDSKAEANRWALLRLLEGQGRISDLRTQVRMPLHTINPDGRKQRVGHYVADFTYRRENGEAVIEDVKGGGIMTDLAAWKLRHVAAEYGTEVLITDGI